MAKVSDFWCANLIRIEKVDNVGMKGLEKAIACGMTNAALIDRVLVCHFCVNVEC
jgi:hypothetical protein